MTKLDWPFYPSVAKKQVESEKQVEFFGTSKLLKRDYWQGFLFEFNQFILFKSTDIWISDDFLMQLIG